MVSYRSGGRPYLTFATAVLAVAFSFLHARAADRPWRRLHGGNVVVFGQQSPRTLRGIAVHLEEFHRIISSFLRGPTQPASLPTFVYAFDDKRSMDPFVPLYNGKPASLGGYCHCGAQSDVNFIVMNIGAYADASRIIFHEYTHQLVRNAVGGGVPVWLNEGLAEYYSTFELTDGRSAHIGKPVASHVLLLRARFIPLGELLAVDHSSALYNEGDRRSIFYAEAWALTHYLMVQRPDGVAGINRYLNASRAAGNEGEAFAQAFGVTPAQMERELRDYVQRPIFKAIDYELKEKLSVDEPEAAATVAPAEAEARLGDVQRRVGRVDEAAPRIERAAATGPDDAYAQLTLALLRLEQDRRQEAGTLLRKAAALAPGDFLTQFTFALTLLRDRTADDDTLTLAHDALAKAVSLNPQSTEALSWLAYSDLVAGERLAEATSAMSKAVLLAPARLDYRLRLAEIYVRYGAFDEAKKMAAPLTSARDDERTAEHARALLDRIEANERRAAERAARERERDEQPARAAEAPPESASSRAVDVPSVENPADTARRLSDESRVRFKLRKVAPGEERAYGELVQLGCGTNDVQFHLRVGTRVVVAVAKRVEDVELTAFGDRQDVALSCGTRTPPDTILLTWKSAPHRPLGAATVVGRAVAVEFVPAGYVP